MKRKVTIAVVVILIIVAGVLFFRSRAQNAAQAQLANLQTEEAGFGSLTAKVGATGTVRANQTANLSWDTSGTVESINAVIGQSVKQGDRLATLEQTSLPQNVILGEAELVSAESALQDLYDAHGELSLAQAEQAVANAEKAVDNAQRAYDNLQYPAAQSYIDQAEANLIIADDKLEQAQENYDKFRNKADKAARAGLQSALAQAQQEYDNAATYYTNVSSSANPINLAVAKADLEVAQAQFEDAKIEYEKLLDGPDPEDIAAAEARVAAAQATLNMAFIDAPFTGVITLAEPVLGDQVAPGLIAFRLDDLEHMFVDVQISEVDINRIAVGQPVQLSFDAILAKEYNGEVVEVSPVGVVVEGLVNFQVRVEITDADEDIKPGMTSAVNIVVNQLDNVLLVPNRAVRVEGGMRIVYILLDQEIQMVEIELGATSDTYSEVAGGDLLPGNLIVLNPQIGFQPGSGPPPFAHGDEGGGP